MRCGSGQDLVFPLVVQLLLDQTLLVFPLSLSSLLSPELLLPLHLSPQVGPVGLAGLLQTAGTKQRPVQSASQGQAAAKHKSAHVPSLLLLVHQLRLLHHSAQLVSL